MKYANDIKSAMLKDNSHSSRDTIHINIDLFLYMSSSVNFVCASQTIPESRHPVAVFAIIRRDERATERGKSGRPTRVTFIFIR